MDEASAAAMPPARLRALASWQVSKVSTLAARLTAQRMPLGARADAAVLAALQEYGPLSQADLGRRLGLDRNDVNGIVNRLEAADHVSRRADRADRRRNIVTMTAEGERALEDLLTRAGQVQAELLQGLDPEEQVELMRLLAKLVEGHGPQSA